jgi:hypothetical protein
MARTAGDRVARLVAEVEKAAKKLRGEVRRRVKAAPMLRGLQEAADRLRERAATAARHIEKYVHEIRTELEHERARKPAAPRRKHPRPRRRRALATR